MVNLGAPAGLDLLAGFSAVSGRNGSVPQGIATGAPGLDGAFRPGRRGRRMSGSTRPRCHFLPRLGSRGDRPPCWVARRPFFSSGPNRAYRGPAPRAHGEPRTLTGRDLSSGLGDRTPDGSPAAVALPAPIPRVRRSALSRWTGRGPGMQGPGALLRGCGHGPGARARQRDGLGCGRPQAAPLAGPRRRVLIEPRGFGIVDPQ